MWSYMQQYHGGVGWFGGPIMMALIWVLLIVGVVVLVRMFVGNGRRDDKDPLNVLKER